MIKLTFKQNANYFSQPYFKLLWWTIRVNATNITNNPHPKFEAVNNEFKCYFTLHNKKSGCRPILTFFKNEK